ncbi:hypothetical protein DFJ58DRAFT_715769 [Suillus subalutaceus]|uniref:uncharacterized protein n=1 Tax=Suillus subalutaceus TaxID=48586 RepID=UPI001B880BE9|nr:uncharacterized protein DFJ58DRAFT_715769 [Suillus subalutaceus]KAG1859029.1 hypothetical protein DFJ58DRAFT_715769 [Suillus subalutaceus]
MGGRDHSQYLALPSEEEVKKCFRAFRSATSNSALAMLICVVCARELMSYEVSVDSIPRSVTLWEGMLLLDGHIKGNAPNATGWLYSKDSHGGNPSHMQRGMAGNATLYDMNTDDVAKMIGGQFLPQPVDTLASIIGITYIGKQDLPKDWLKSTFCVRRAVVFNALVWLKANNPLYADIQISEDLLARLPEDEVPEEIISIIRHEASDDVAMRESEGYVPSEQVAYDQREHHIYLEYKALDDQIMLELQGQGTLNAGNHDVEGLSPDSRDGSSVIPLQFLGITDTELSKLPLNDLMKYALMNLDDNEGGYAVRHSHNPVSDFARDRGGKESNRINPLAATYPKLFPYGVGGIEAMRTKSVGFDEHVRWALQYHDRRFRTHHSFPFKRKALQSAQIQMRRKDFERDAQAEKEEADNKFISNPRVRILRKHVFAMSGQVVGSDNARARYRGQMWGTCLCLCGPSLWMTINPTFTGETINLDDFDLRAAQNIARDPFAAAKYFFFIIKAILLHLFQINATSHQVHSEMGAQGRGTLHVHMMVWLQHTPNMVEMHALLHDDSFCARVRNYIQQNIRAHVDGLDEETIRSMPKESGLPYSHPPNPDLGTWQAESQDVEHRVVRSQQVHTHGQLLSPVDVIDEHGRWSPKRTYAFLNNYCPAITTTLRCNNDIKLLTNAWYLTGYSTKKQNKNNNVSALMANTLLYHQGHSNHLDGTLDRNRLLLFRCQHAINREMEMSGPQVMAYLMNWGDIICSHHYVPLYWFALKSHLLEAFPELKEDKTR